MVIRVAQACRNVKGNPRVIVATDDDRIEDCCTSYDVATVRTPSNCQTGTDRVFEAVRDEEYDFVINVQGDEPLIHSTDIDTVVATACEGYPVVNAMCPTAEMSEIESYSVPKVVTDMNGRLLYMSRSPIPATKSGPPKNTMKQVCIYAFDRASLETFGTRENKTPCEASEDIEILRFLELGLPVQMVQVGSASIAVDHPEDVSRVIQALRREGN